MTAAGEPMTLFTFSAKYAPLRTLLPCAFLLLAVCGSAHAQAFSCSNQKNAVALSASTIYNDVSIPTGTIPTGFDLNTAPTTFTGNACSSDKPFYFSLAVPEGNYQVTVQLGGPQASVNTVRAEARRLMVMQQPVAAGKSATVTFNVAVRVPQIAGAFVGAPPSQVSKQDAVHLKPREIGALDWDNKLTLEFNGTHPSVRSIAIKRIDVKPIAHIPTVYLAGDSTVVDQDKEPWAAWGQMLPAFFADKVVIANHAESGETIRSFQGERRFAKIFSTIQPGDFLLIQFAHNDQKPGSGFVSIPDYKDLMRKYIAQARDKGATPILVTSMNRRTFDATGRITQTLGDYPQATRDIGAEQHVAVIDLNAMSKTLYEALGDAGTLKAFVHYPANTFPDQPEELKDDTHFNSYGALELAKCIVQSIRDQHLPLAQYLKPNLPLFDPSHPDTPEAVALPPSPAVSSATPYGR